MDIKQLLAQATRGRNTTTEQSGKQVDNPPHAILRVPNTELEFGLWGRTARDGTKRYSFSLSRTYSKRGEKLLARTFRVDPANAAEVIYAYSYAFETFSNDQGLSLEVRQGFADLALRLATAFEFTTQNPSAQPDAEMQLVNGGTLSQAAGQSGSVNGTSSVLGLAS